MKRALLTGILAFLIFVPMFVQGSTIPFGSTGHHQRFTMIPGETREADLSFFNYGNDPISVQVVHEGSNEILSSITPRYFILEDWKNVNNPAGEESWVAMGEKYVKSVPVHIKLKVPERSELTKNYHVVKITAIASKENPEGDGIREDVKVVREVRYSITVPGNIKALTESEYNRTVEQFYQEMDNNGMDRETGGNEESNSGDVSWNVNTEENKETGDGKTENRQLPTGFFSLGSDDENSNSYIIPAVIIILLIIIAYIRFRR